MVGSYTTPEGLELKITYIANFDDTESAQSIHEDFLNGLASVLSEFTGGKTLEEMGPKPVIE